MTPSYKDIAVNFLALATQGKIREAYKQYASSNFIHHNPHFKGDAESLAVAMESNHNAFPNKRYVVKHVLDDGKFITVHGCVQLQEGGKTIIVVHIFRFENDKIAEMWDVAEEIPKDSPNENGVF